MHARLAEEFSHEFFMFLLDGTPGPTFPSWALSEKPSCLKGRFCIPLYWEIAKSYSDDQWYFFLSLKWWPKNANFLITIKYHMLRALLSEPGISSNMTFFDQFDGGSENRNFPNFAFLAEAKDKLKLKGVEGSRLITNHSHNEGDAKITAPRASYTKTACLNLGDVVRALLSPFASHRKKPQIVIVRQVYNWTTRANAIKNPHLKNLGMPHQWKVERAESGDPGITYKDYYSSDEEWMGADGVPGGRAVELFKPGRYADLQAPELVPQFPCPFSDAAVASTKVAIKQLMPHHPSEADRLRRLLNNGATNDRDLGLDYKREFQPGKIGFPGTLTTSNGISVSVRVLAGLPPAAQLWSFGKPEENCPEVSGPRAPLVNTRVQDARAQSVRGPRWECACGKNYMTRDCSRARKHAQSCKVGSLSQETNGSSSSDEDSSSDSEDSCQLSRDPQLSQASQLSLDSQLSQASQRQSSERRNKRSQRSQLTQSQQSLDEPMAIMNGDKCGHCRLELDDSSKVLECNFDEKRGRNRYVCEHVFHKECIQRHYAPMYTSEFVQSIQDEQFIPQNWACPSCTGCVHTKVIYKQNDKVFYCQHCESPFLKAAAQRNRMQCFYCRLEM